MKRVYSRGEAIDIIWQYSRYYGHQLGYCLDIRENGHASLVYLLALTENFLKSELNDFDDTFFNIINKTAKRSLINESERQFLNDKNIGIRRIRNILAHANLAKYNVVFEGDELLYPFTENETCQMLFSVFSNAILNIILKIISGKVIIPINVETKELISCSKFKIIEITPEQIMSYKGYNINDFGDSWSEIPEADRYRLAENQPDANIMTHILKGIKNQ